jgi:hypothetical protein
MNFRCYCLFDITPGGSIGRTRPQDDTLEWVHKRNTQSNFDTILQIISLRSQPEVVTDPRKLEIKLDDRFGFLFEHDEPHPCWTFDFDIQHLGVFNDGISEFGKLYSDCDLVPMIKCGTEWDKLPAFLDSSDELRNIYFEVI